MKKHLLLLVAGFIIVQSTEALQTLAQRFGRSIKICPIKIQNKESTPKIPNPTPQTTRSSGEIGYIMQAKELFRENANSPELHKLKQYALNEYAKSKIPHYQQLFLVDYDVLTEQQKPYLSKMPFYHHMPSSYQCTVKFNGCVSIKIKKFLITNEIPVGWIAYSYLNNENKLLQYSDGWISYLGVAEPYRKFGYGAYLLQGALNDMVIAGVPTVELESDVDALNFYKKFGFSLMGRSRMQIKL